MSSDSLLPSAENQTCVQCGKTAVSACGNCKTTFYCSAMCQARHWTLANHASQCSPSLKLVGNGLLTAEEASARLEPLARADGPFVVGVEDNSDDMHVELRWCRMLRVNNLDIIDPNVLLKEQVPKNDGQDSLLLYTVYIPERLRRRGLLTRVFQILETRGANERCASVVVGPIVEEGDAMVTVCRKRNYVPVMPLSFMKLL